MIYAVLAAESNEVRCGWHPHILTVQLTLVVKILQTKKKFNLSTTNAEFKLSGTEKNDDQFSRRLPVHGPCSIWHHCEIFVSHWSNTEVTLK